MEWIEDRKCKATVALEFMKLHRHGRRFIISADVWLPTGEDRGFNGHTGIRVTYREAQRVVKDLLENFEKRGAHIRVKVSERLIFIG